MEIAIIGYIFGENKITVSYDTVDKIFFIREEYLDEDIGVKMGFSYSVKSKKAVRGALKRFKRDFRNK